MWRKRRWGRRGEKWRRGCEETEQSNQEKAGDGGRGKHLLSLQKDLHRSELWMFPLFSYTQQPKYTYCWEVPTWASVSTPSSEHLGRSHMRYWKGNHPGRVLIEQAWEAGFTEAGLPISSCSLVNEYEILTQGWPHRCSGKQSHFKPVNCTGLEGR